MTCYTSAFATTSSSGNCTSRIAFTALSGTTSIVILWMSMIFVSVCPVSTRITSVPSGVPSLMILMDRSLMSMSGLSLSAMMESFYDTKYPLLDIQ